MKFVFLIIKLIKIIWDVLNILINEVEFENTFLVVKGLSLDVILGNDFLERNGAVIDFNKQIVKF